MWLLPAFSRVASFAVRTFYRLDVAGGKVPESGPVLLVANHPNSLLDPATVAAVAERPVRFLAKAPLFSDRAVGWLVRGAGSIPVYRASDDPTRMNANQDMFRAVHEALAEGSAVGIFPEGTSHSAPSLVPLKTGAARIALGAAARLGRDFPVVPVGLVFRRKERFRSDALAVVGDPVRWEDLRGAGTDEAEAVRELTRRIDDALREVTVNLERWEDAPLVECAEEIYAAERGLDEEPAERLERLRDATEVLARLRAEDRAEWRPIAREVSRHRRMLRALRLRPADLRSRTGLRAAAGWTLRKLAFFSVGGPLAALGSALFYVPYRLTGVVEGRVRPEHDVRATYKVLVGGLLHLAWVVLLGAVAWAWAGPRVGAAVLLGLPLLGVVTVAVRSRWDEALESAGRFLRLRQREELVEELRVRQREIADRLEALRTGVGV